MGSFLASIAAFGQEPPQTATLTDARDGQVYKIVEIVGRWWMAENLNYGKQVMDNQPVDDALIEKSCYANDLANCLIYGGLYTWHEAIQKGKETKNQGVCPTGWYVPSLKDWQMLSDFLGTDSAGHKMKASGTDDPAWDGSNESGFSAIPSGTGYQYTFGRLGQWAVFWTSTEKDDRYAYFAQLDGYWNPKPPKYLNLYLGDYYIKDNAFSIRCIREESE